MHTPTSQSVFLQYYRSAASLRAGDFDPAQAWPAPVAKAATLVLRRPAPLSQDILVEPTDAADSRGAAPFPSPVRENAFALPRPAVLPGASSAWAPPQRKSPTAVLTGAPVVHPDVEFPRSPRFTEKLSMRHGQFCRSC